MTEAGGATTQAGIHYQNSVAATKLADLLDLRPSPPRERVTNVRIEAPTDVDDIVVSYADGHREFISAKTSLRSSGDPWERLWTDFRREARAARSRPDDRFTITVSDRSPTSEAVQALCRIAATSPAADEMLSRATAPQRDVLARIGGDDMDDAARYELLRRVELVVQSEDDVKREFENRRDAGIDTSPNTLLALLRDMAGGHARTRRSFTAPSLRAGLAAEHGVHVLEPPEWGVGAYRDAMRRSATIGVPGAGLAAPAREAIFWPTVRDWVRVARTDFEDETPPEFVDATDAPIDLRLFPSEELRRCILVAGPGHGKSALLTAISATIVDGPVLPVVIPLASLAASGNTVAEFLEEHVNRKFDVKIAWRRLAEQGLVALLLDGLDEVPERSRAKLLEDLRIFSARYPNVAWLLTVRDPSIILGVNEARVLEILPLSDGDVVRFADKVAERIPAVDGEELLQRLRIQPDLRRLARIPLFLTLMIVAMGATGTLPGSRADLIEGYLHTLFAPHDHKVVDPTNISPQSLRVIAARLAFERLEAGEIGASEREIATVARQVVGLDRTDEAIASLSRNGILRPESSIRYVFPFPTVQEYLAATYLVEQQPDTLASRIDDAIRRTWAQVLQFALELHPAPTPVMQEMLARPDDAFATGLRLVARCLANGAKATPPLAAEVSDRLVGYWTQAHWDARDRVGQLILDVFADPISPTLRAALHHHWLLGSKGGEIISRAASTELTTSVLERLLSRPIDRHNMYHSLKPALADLREAAFDRIMAATRATDLADDEWSGLDDLLSLLPTGSVEREKASRASRDTNLPPEVRINCIRLAEKPLDDDSWHLLVSSLASEDWRYWRVVNLLAEVDEPERRLETLLADDAIPVRRRREVAVRLATIIDDFDARRHLVDRVSCDDKIDPEIVASVRLICARYGDLDAFRSLVEALDTLPIDIAHNVLALFGHFPSAALAARAAGIVEARTLAPDEVAQMAGGAEMGMRYLYEMDHGFGGTLKDVPPHAGTAIWGDLIGRWVNRPDLTDSQRLDIASRAGKLGSEASRDVVTEMVLAIEDPDDPRYDDGNALGQIMRTAVNDTRMRVGQVPIDLAERLARSKRPNVPYAGVAAIEAHASRPALELLLRLHNEETTRADRDSLEAAVERLSGRLSIVIVRNGRRLEISG